MKKITVIAAAVVALVSCDNTTKVDQVVLDNNIDSVSYAIGVSQGKGLLSQVPEINVAAFLRGFQDVSDSADHMLADEDIQEVLQAFSVKKQQEQMLKQQAENEAKYGDVKAQGVKFLEENMKKEGVQVTASGLQYIVLKEGTGGQPNATSNVEVHYHGTTPDGVVFDSSVDRGESISFNLNQVIPGWTEGVSLMKEGAKYKFFIPQELAYGANAPQGGQGPIKPFMPLVFEVELIKINN